MQCPSRNKIREYGWKPWQIHPVLLLFVVAVAAGLAGVLEVMAKRNQPQASLSTLRDSWLGWYQYAVHQNDPEAPTLDQLPVTFESPGDCLEGLVDLLLLQDDGVTPYFVWAFLPSVIAVLFGILWGVIDSEIKRIEPFYQMLQPGGASGRQSIFAEYIDLPTFLSPIQAIYWRQWVVLLSALCYVLISVITPILQALLFQVQIQALMVGYHDNHGNFKPLGYWIDGIGDLAGFSSYDDYLSQGAPTLIGNCSVLGDDYVGSTITAAHAFNLTTPDDQDLPDSSQNSQTAYAIRPVLTLNVGILQAQESILLATAVLALALALILTLRKSSMPSSLGSVASLASLAHAYPEFMFYTSQIMTQDKENAKQWRHFLSTETIHLGRRPLPPAPLRPAVSPMSGDSNQAVTDTVPELDHTECLETDREPFGLYFDPFSKATPIPLPPGERTLAKPSRPSKRRGFIAVVGTIGCAVIMVALDITAKGTNVLDVENSAVPFGVLILSAFTKSFWKSVEHTVIATAPFRRRGLGEMPINLRPFPIFGREYSRLPPGWVTCVAIYDRQWAIGFITFASICFEVAFLLLAVIVSTSLGIGTGAIATLGGNNALIFDLILMAFFILVAIGSVLFAQRSRNSRSGYTLPRLLPHCSPSSLAAMLGYIASSQQLLDEMQPVCEMRTAKERMKYLSELESLYYFGKVTTPNVIGGSSIGLRAHRLSWQEASRQVSLGIGVRRMPRHQIIRDWD